MAPMSSACVVTAMMWLSSRVISAKSTGGGGGTARGEPRSPLVMGGRLSLKAPQGAPQYLGSTGPAAAGGC